MAIDAEGPSIRLTSPTMDLSIVSSRSLNIGLPNRGNFKRGLYTMSDMNQPKCSTCLRSVVQCPKYTDDSGLESSPHSGLTIGEGPSDAGMTEFACHGRG